MVLLSSQTTEHYTTVYFPVNGQPLSVSVRDTDNIELSNIYFDKSQNKLMIRGDLQLGLTKLVESYEQVLTPANALNLASNEVRRFLNSNGTVKRRDSLTWAIKYYDSVKLHYGIIDL
jgi:hypothetical protein